MATTLQERTRLFRLLNATSLDALLVRVAITGEIQVVAEGSGPTDRVSVRLEGGQEANLLEYAPLDWWRTSTSLVDAVDQGWLTVPENQAVEEVVQLAEEEPPALEDHLLIQWRPTDEPEVSPTGSAYQHFDAATGKLRVSENGGPYLNVLEPLEVTPVSYAATVTVDFSPNNPVLRDLALTGNVTFASSNLGPGRRATLRISTDGSSRNLTFPASWVFIGRSSPPSSLAPNKQALLTLVSFGVTDANVVALFQANSDPDLSGDSQFITIKDSAYGAVGDGVTDDTDAIQAALTAAGALYTATGTRQSVYVPAGVYLVSKAAAGWCLSVPSGVHLWGPGRIKMAALTDPNVAIISVQDVQNVLIEGITIDGNSGAQAFEVDPKNHGIFTRGSQDVIIRNVIAESIDGDAFYFGKSSTVGNPNPYAQNCRVENFWVTGSRRSAVTIARANWITVSRGYAIGWSGEQSACINIESDSEDSHGCVFEDVYIDNPAPESAHTCYGISLTGGNETLIRRCYLPSTIIVTNSDNVSIEGCVWDHPGGAFDFGNGGHPGESCIQARTTLDGLRIENNVLRISGAIGGDAAFDIACVMITNTNANRPKDVVIKGNRCFPGGGRYGIYMAGLAGVTLVKDNFIDCAGTDLGIIAFTPNNAMEDVVIEGNVIRNASAANGAIAVTTTANGASNGFQRVAVRGNRIIDDQTVATCTHAIKFLNTGSSGFGDVVIDSNQWTSNIVNGIYGINTWRLGGNYDGTATTTGDFEGYGVPAIVAGAGSTFRRRDGGAGTSFYVKESSTGSSNWVAK